MNNKNIVGPSEASYVIGNYNMYVGDVYSALERLQDYLKDTDVKRVFENDSQEIQEMMEESNVIPDFVAFMEQLKDAMGY